MQYSYRLLKTRLINTPLYLLALLAYLLIFFHLNRISFEASNLRKIPTYISFKAKRRLENFAAVN